MKVGCSWTAADVWNENGVKWGVILEGEQDGAGGEVKWELKANWSGGEIESIDGDKNWN